MKTKALVFAGMGFELVGIILSCIYFGQYFDSAYHLKGLGLVGFSAMGLIGWLIHVVALLKKFDSDEGKSPDPDNL